MRPSRMTVPYITWPTRSEEIIMEVVDNTWFKEIKNPDMFYTNVTTFKLLDHLTDCCLGIHAVDAADISQLMKTLYGDADGIQKFINAMEAAQIKHKHAKL